ncbi:MAG: glycosyltransferase family 25 protein [Rhodobacterales bacterium]|nr:glycosyltransferase family 25 protein [Rhodobacterales bacterium]MDX5412187.1 glycosyltransferase family 25 protein [Rhodobacterales bacterium]
MAMPVPAYLINLDQNTDRLAASRAALTAAGLQPVRVPAVDGRGLDLNNVADCDAQAALRRYGRPLKGGEYGCYKSHLACAQRMLDEGHEVALVFEDDITLHADFGTRLGPLLDYLTQSVLDWHMVNLGAPGTRIFTPLTDLGAGHRLVAAHYFPQTAHAILWSRAGATAFVRDHARVGMSVDNLFRHVMIRSGKGLAVTPPLVGTTAAASVIDAGQRASRYAGQRWNYGLLKQKRFWVNRVLALCRKAVYRPPATDAPRPGLPDPTA